MYHEVAKRKSVWKNTQKILGQGGSSLGMYSLIFARKLGACERCDSILIHDDSSCAGWTELVIRQGVSKWTNNHTYFDRVEERAKRKKNLLVHFFKSNVTPASVVIPFMFTFCSESSLQAKMKC